MKKGTLPPLFFILYNMYYMPSKKNESDGATMINGIGQGSFAAALASSINVQTAVDEITKGKVTARIGDMELNSLIFQDNIAKMHFTL